MYRNGQLLGYVLTAFGTGILLGSWAEGGFWCNCIGIGLLLSGISMICKR